MHCLISESPNFETAEVCISFVYKHAPGLTTSRRILAENVPCLFEWVRLGTGFEFLMTVTVNIAIFCYVTTYSLVELFRRVMRACWCHHLYCVEAASSCEIRRKSEVKFVPTLN